MLFGKIFEEEGSRYEDFHISFDMFPSEKSLVVTSADSYQPFLTLDALQRLELLY